mmetsp:Transcript_26248/g.52627  ORF Transcript_26248/g.52627 Transcript_26248/m.52627 type:complete len:213 (+) Transcript_26248:527-1165(+)
MAFTGYMMSTPPDASLCALKAYLRCCASGDASMYSTATRPSTDPSVYPSPEGIWATQRVWHLSEDSRRCHASSGRRRSIRFTCLPAVATTTSGMLADGAPGMPAQRASTLSDCSKLPTHACGARTSQSLTVRSHEPETRHDAPPAAQCRTHRTADPCSPSTTSASLLSVRCKHTRPSSAAEATCVPSPMKSQSRTGDGIEITLRCCKEAPES